MPLKIAYRHVFEEFVRVQTYLLIGGQEAKVGVLFGCLFIVVARADLCVVTDFIAAPCGYEADLGVYFKVLEAVNYCAARFLQLFRPVYVVLFVKSRAQLYETRYVLAVFCGGAEIVDNLGLWIFL